MPERRDVRYTKRKEERQDCDASTGRLAEREISGNYRMRRREASLLKYRHGRGGIEKVMKGICMHVCVHKYR